MATRHVENSKAMRELLNRKIYTDRLEMNYEVPWGERKNVLIGDYSQYMYLPLFCKKQPGESYYFVPLNVNNFGLVNVDDLSTGFQVRYHLYSHVYMEGSAKSGGN